MAGVMLPCNTKRGIAAFVTDLEGLNQLVRLRAEAHYECGHRLGEFVVLGYWVLDRSGNLFRLAGFPKERFPYTPDVLTLWEFQRYVQECASLRGGEEIETLRWVSAYIPPAGITCPWCGESWTLANAHDVYVEYLVEDVVPWGLVGTPLAEVELVYGERTDAVYQLLASHDQILKANGTLATVGDAYTIREGDKVRFHVWRYFHKSCWRRLFQRSPYRGRFRGF
jgi:hypothetical protein